MTKREIKDKNILDQFVIDICKVIEKHCKYIICSGFVAIAHGRARGTEDIDMIIERLTLLQFERLHKDLIKSGFECLYGSNSLTLYNDYLKKLDSLRYVRKGILLPELEIKFAKDELDYEQLKNRIKLPLTGLDVYFSTIETNIAFKEEYLTSEKDKEDAKHLRIIYKDKLNENEIERIKKDIRRLRL